MIRTSVSLGVVLLLSSLGAPAPAEAACDPDGLQSSGSIYRICMPAPEEYNGYLVLWAHGYQDAGTPVEIPEEQLCFDGACLNDLVTDLGFAFATNSYSKTGLAVLEGKDDILDLVKIFSEKKGTPKRVYLVGASEGGLITALAVEQHPDVFGGGVAACGPIGSFPFEVNYFGDARVTFNHFFPGVIPGDPFDPAPWLVASWQDYYESIVKPIVFLPVNRQRLDQWVRVARLPFDPADYLTSVEVSVRDALRYGVVNVEDVATTIGGFPFDNQTRWYRGSDNDLLLNLLVLRASADPAAIATMNTSYNTTGVLESPLITLHTLKDQQVPYLHEQLYSLKTLASGSFLTRHLNIPVDRFEHCNFTIEEALVAFGLMLLYDAALDNISGVGSYLTGPQLKRFERLAQTNGLPYTRAGSSLKIRLK